MHVQDSTGEARLRLLLDTLYPATPKALYAEAPLVVPAGATNSYLIAEATLLHQHHIAFLNGRGVSPRVAENIEALAASTVQRMGLDVGHAYFWETEIDCWDGRLRARRVTFRDAAYGSFTMREWALPSQMPTALQYEVERVYRLAGVRIVDALAAGGTEPNLEAVETPSQLIHPDNTHGTRLSDFEPSARSEEGGTHPTHCAARQINVLARMRIACTSLVSGRLRAKTTSYLRALSVLISGGQR